MEDLSDTEKENGMTERETPEWGQEIQTRSRWAVLPYKLSTFCVPEKDDRFYGMKKDDDIRQVGEVSPYNCNDVIQRPEEIQGVAGGMPSQAGQENHIERDSWSDQSGVYSQPLAGEGEQIAHRQRADHTSQSKVHEERTEQNPTNPSHEQTTD